MSLSFTLNLLQFYKRHSGAIEKQPFVSTVPSLGFWSFRAAEDTSMCVNLSTQKSYSSETHSLICYSCLGVPCQQIATIKVGYPTQDKMWWCESRFLIEKCLKKKNKKKINLSYHLHTAVVKQHHWDVFYLAVPDGVFQLHEDISSWHLKNMWWAADDHRAALESEIPKIRLEWPLLNKFHLCFI